MSDEAAVREAEIEAAVEARIQEELKKRRPRERELEQELEAARKDAAFTKAGIPEGPLGDLIRKGYEGPMEPDAIKEFASKVIPLSPPNPTSGGLSAEDQAQLDRLKRIQAGVTDQGDGPQKDPFNDYADRIRAISDTLTEEEGVAQVQAILAEARRDHPELGVGPGRAN